MILRVLGVYESNTFQRLIYELNNSLRNKSEADCRAIFDKLIIKTLQDEERLEKTFTGSVAEIHLYLRTFQNCANNSANFSKYVLMRIDRWLAELLDKPSYCTGSPADIEDGLNRSSRKRYGMHLEHIYAHNDANQKIFLIHNGCVPTCLFDQTRNYLGMVLLSKDSEYQQQQ